MSKSEPIAAALDSCADALRALAQALRAERLAQPAGPAPDRLVTAAEAAAVLGDRGCLVHVQRHILGCPFHESRSLLWTTGLGRLHGSSKGRALNMR